MDLINKIKVDLHYEKYFDVREIIGCTDEEIIELEKMHPNRIQFPSTYKEFLKFSGKRFSYFRPTSTFYFQDLILLWDDGFFNKFFKENSFRKRFFVNTTKTMSFPNDGFIFTAHLGYQFRFFKCDSSSDPIVYYFDDKPDREDYLNTNLKFSELIIDYLKDFIIRHENMISKNKPLSEAIGEFKKRLFEFIDFSYDYSKIENKLLSKDIIGSYERILIDMYDLFLNEDTIGGALQDYVLLQYTDDMNKELYREYQAKAVDLYEFYKNNVKPLI